MPRSGARQFRSYKTLEKFLPLFRGVQKKFRGIDLLPVIPMETRGSRQEWPDEPPPPPGRAIGQCRVGPGPTGLGPAGVDKQGRARRRRRGGWEVGVLPWFSL